AGDRAMIVADYTAAGPIDARDLRRVAEQRIFRAAVPSAFVFHRALPLTPNGKVDAKALPSLSEVLDQLTRSDDAPATPVAEAVAALWRDLLSLPAVGRHGNFFELGGDSLLAVGLFSRISATLGVSLPISTLVSAPTIQQLSAVIDEQREDMPAAPLVPLRSS